MRARELIVTYRANPDAPSMGNRTISSPQAAAALFVPLLEHQAQEVFIVALLNAKHRLLAIHEVGRGNLTSVEVSPRLIVRAALLIDAAAIVLAHNHPSGDPTPSTQDYDVTRKIKAAADLFDIDTVDHLIIGEQAYVSLKERNGTL